MTALDMPDNADALAELRAMHRRGAYDDIVARTAALLARRPNDRDALLLRASALRMLKRTDEALTTLDALITAHPRFSVAHQERGLCYVAMKAAPAAIEGFLTAVNINPALPQSWRMLEGLYRMTGDLDNASTAAAHSATLAALPHAVVQATALFADDDLAQAEALIREFLLREGDHPEGMRLLAKIALAYDVLEDAEALLSGVLTLAPEHLAARTEYASVLIKRQKYRQAYDVICAQLATQPDNLDLCSLAATALGGVGRHDEAIALYRHIAARVPQDADIPLWLGHALKTIGALADAIEAYQAAIALRPAFGDAWWSLANLKTYRFSDAEISAMHQAEADRATPEIDRVQLNFALGKAYEDAGCYANSWAHYAAGNALQRAASKYRPEILETNTRLQRAVCTPSFFEARKGWGAPAPDPIFIVGLPRAGSTLIEQILASHSMVEGTQELIDIQRMVIALQGRDPDLDNPRYPEALLQLSATDARALGERYLADTRMYRTDTPYFIDKMPNNFRHIGLIQMILPNAKIIDARREPMACCFSNLKQLFAQGQEFTYSIPDIARYYRTYLDLMTHWDEVLPDRVLRVHHEDVVEDLESLVRRILAYCGLDFEQSCVDFYRTKRSVRTPSAEQVRQPIYRDGLDQWRHFEQWLTPLRDELGDAIERYRD